VITELNEISREMARTPLHLYNQLRNFFGFASQPVPPCNQRVVYLIVATSRWDSRLFFQVYKSLKSDNWCDASLGSLIKNSDL